MTSKFFKIQQISTNMTELRTFVFELWAEKKKLLGNMDMVSALASFFHLCFTFNLKYLKVSF